MCGCVRVCVLLLNVGGDGCVREGGALVLIGEIFRKLPPILLSPQRLVRDAKIWRRPCVQFVMRWHDRLVEALFIVRRKVSGIAFAPTPHRHLPKKVMFGFQTDSSKRCLGVVGDATIHERAAPILQQSPLQHIHVQQRHTSMTKGKKEVLGLAVLSRSTLSPSLPIKFTKIVTVKNSLAGCFCNYRCRFF